jgi:transcriptional regulator with XRE-family HTH domain
MSSGTDHGGTDHANTDHGGTDHGGTDLGRRIQEYRSKAGLTRAEAAAQAGMAADYLGYLETSLEPNPTQAAMARLAAVLGTTARTLAGAGLDLPPGRKSRDGRAVLQPLTAAECREFLGKSGIGRFLFTAARGPVAILVNYAMLGDDIVFRTTDQTSLAARAGQGRVSFEVDHLDEALAEGWSVLVSGEASVVAAPDELEQVSALGIVPWAGGDRDTYIRITARDVTGRRIRISA